MKRKLNGKQRGIRVDYEQYDEQIEQLNITNAALEKTLREYTQRIAELDEENRYLNSFVDKLIDKMFLSRGIH